MISDAPASPTPGAYAHDHVDITADVGMVHRPFEGDGSSGDGLAYGAHLSVNIVPWLRVATYYLFARQSVSFDGVAASFDLSNYVLGARLEPTWNIGQRLHLWASAGAGWGVVKQPHLHFGDGGYDLADRDGVWLELPLGVGGMFDVIPHWMGVGLDALWGPVIAQTGEIFDRAQALNPQGSTLYIGGMPTWKSSLTLVAGVTLKL